VGDHHNDVVVARAAGVPAIFAAWGYGSPGMADGSTAVARDITEAAAIANRLLPGL
jgi:phosphoglycolate phosphatase